MDGGHVGLMINQPQDLFYEVTPMKLDTSGGHCFLRSNKRGTEKPKNEFSRTKNLLLILLLACSADVSVGTTQISEDC